MLCFPVFGNSWQETKRVWHKGKRMGKSWFKKSHFFFICKKERDFISKSRYQFTEINSPFRLKFYGKPTRLRAPPLWTWVLPESSWGRFGVNHISRYNFRCSCPSWRKVRQEKLAPKTGKRRIDMIRFFAQNRKRFPVQGCQNDQNWHLNGSC